MDMSNDEIVMCYRQAKHKGEQIKMLADRNVTADSLAALARDVLKNI